MITALVAWVSVNVGVAVPNILLDTAAVTAACARRLWGLEHA
jgi:hypothetical protein